jgi:hypothetical protein
MIVIPAVSSNPFTGRGKGSPLSDSPQATLFGRCLTINILKGLRILPQVQMGIDQTRQNNPSVKIKGIFGIQRVFSEYLFHLSAAADQGSSQGLPGIHGIDSGIDQLERFHQVLFIRGIRGVFIISVSGRSRC